MMNVTRETPRDLLQAQCGDEIATPDGVLVVAARHDVDLRSGICETAILTSDGRPFTLPLRGWHNGPEHDWVQAEAHRAHGRVWHGYIDSQSRLPLQCG